MFKPVIVATTLMVALGSASAFAQSTPTDARTHAVEGLETSSYTPAPGNAKVDNKSAVKADDRNCLRETGSMIKAKKGKCLPVAGRVYSKDDLDRTGERNLGPALEKLDPSISTRGH
ncbi:hypothetical protein [Dyella subtropica]|uniref:hypothetical protein n=1 Tax=Dyella subtropica TaxID=2992127 RepID=UPI00225B28D0|nr:hypothetical protein [Dyella subtropica]